MAVRYRNILSTTVSDKTIELLEKYCEEHMTTKARAIDFIINDYFKKKEGEK